MVVVVGYEQCFIPPQRRLAQPATSKLRARAGKLAESGKLPVGIGRGKAPWGGDSSSPYLPERGAFLLIYNASRLAMCPPAVADERWEADPPLAGLHTGTYSVQT